MLDPEADQAASCFHQSIKIARQQKAKSWELRAGMSLARLYQNQNKRAEAHGLLEPNLQQIHRGIRYGGSARSKGAAR